MAEGFSVRVEVGPLAPIAEVSRIVECIAITSGAALEMALRQVQLSAEGDVRLRLLSGSNNDSVYDLFGSFIRSDDDANELRLWLRSFRTRRTSPAGGTPPRQLIDYKPSPAAWSAALPVAGRRAVSAQVMGAYPEPVTVASLTYSNPIEAILVASGGVLASLSMLLRVIRDFSARRRQAIAVAAEVEDVTRARHELRWRLLRDYANGDLMIPVDDLVNLVSSEQISAMLNLASYSPEIADPSGSND